MVIWVCQNDPFQAVTSLAFLAASIPASETVSVFGCSVPDSVIDLIGRCQDSGLLDYADLSYEDPDTAADRALRYGLSVGDSRPIVICRSSIVVGSGAIESAARLLEVPAAANRKQIAMVGGLFCPAVPAYRICGTRTYGVQPVSLPLEALHPGFVVISSVQEIAYAPIGRDCSGWIRSVRRHGFEAGVPYEPNVPVQVIDRAAFTDGPSSELQLFYRIANKDRRSREVQVPGFNPDEWRVRADDDWAAMSSGAAIERVCGSDPRFKAIRQWHAEESAKVQPVKRVVLDRSLPEKAVEPDAPRFSDAVRESKPVPVGSGRIGVALLCCKRFHQPILALGHLLAYKTPKTDIHVWIDRPKTGEAPGPLVAALQRLYGAGHIASLRVLDRNAGLTQLVTEAITTLATSGDYEYVVRLEDDILIGPQLFDYAVEVIRRGDSTDRPVGYVAGQVTQRPIGLKPVRIRRVGPFTLGVHGHNSLEGFTLLRCDLGSHGFSWALEHPKAYNCAWLEKLRAIGFDGVSLIEPVAMMQHIGHRTTVPAGTPVVPARTWAGATIKLPFFDFTTYLSSRTEEGEHRYALRMLRQLGVQIPADAAAALIDSLN